ncbi:hypothetical protein ACFJIW_14625 [Tahibacter sp. UC22_41]|uniref:TolB family protein n=1 Tax=Tahibacter sp. UC22_41 TaxID=3350178 RepID=UPI0036DB033D
MSTYCPTAARALYAAPDGDTVRVVTRDLDGRPARRISALNGGAEFAPAVSPDGRTIAYQHFVDGGCRIRLHALADGSERDLAGCNPRFAEWLEFSPDGQFLLTPRMRAGDTAMSLHRIALDDGKVGAWDYPHDAAISDVQARHSPDGSQLAIRRGAQPHSSLWLLDLRRGTQRELVDDGFGLDGYAWLPDGSALLVGAHDGAGAGLWRVDARSGERVYLGLRGATCPVVAAGNGALLFTRSARRYALMRIGVDGNAETDPPQAFATSVGADWYPRLSADGRHVAFLSDRDGPVAVYVADTDGGRPQRLPDLPGLVPQARPAFTPDARRVLVPMRGTDGHGALYETSLDAPHWQRIGEAAGDVEQVLVPVDGRWTYYVVRDVNGDRALWRRSRESGAEQHLVDNLARGPIDGDAHGGIYTSTPRVRPCCAAIPTTAATNPGSTTWVTGPPMPGPWPATRSMRCANRPAAISGSIASASARRRSSSSPWTAFRRSVSRSLPTALHCCWRGRRAVRRSWSGCHCRRLRRVAETPHELGKIAAAVIGSARTGCLRLPVIARDDATSSGMRAFGVSSNALIGRRIFSFDFGRDLAGPPRAESAPLHCRSAVRDLHARYLVPALAAGPARRRRIAGHRCQSAV